MNDPKRLLEEGADDFERGLLSAHRQDAGSDQLLRATLVAMGVGAAAGTAAATAAGATAACGSAAGVSAAKAVVSGSTAVVAAKLSGAIVLKWIGLGVLGGVVTLGVAGANHHFSSSNRAVTTPAAVLAQPASTLLPNQGASHGAASAAASADTTQPEPAPSAQPGPASPPRSENHSALIAAASAPSLASPEAPSSTPAPVASQATPVASLSDEVAALDRVRTALAARNGSEALRSLDRYHRDFPKGVLGPEATVLRIEALALSGDNGSARALAERFLQSPGSAAHATHVRSLVKGLSNP